jgi:hypothetical protein
MRKPSTLSYVKAESSVHLHYTVLSLHDPDITSPHEDEKQEEGECSEVASYAGVT